MRLGQLSRQVNVSQKEIVSFLKKKKGIELKVHPNVKVEDDFADLIIKSFSESVVEESAVEPTSKQEEIVVEKETSAQPAETDIPEVMEYAQGEEFIRPDGPIEKIETEVPTLEGIKVVGKIDLPEFHKEEPAPDKAPESSNDEAVSDEKASDKSIVVPNASPLFKSRKKRKPKSKPNAKGNTKPTISEEERKQKELAQAEAKRKAIKKAKKEEARKKHLELVKSYEAKQKAKTKSKSKTQKKDVPKVTNENSPAKKVPKTLIGKIWRWMNTE